MLNFTRSLIYNSRLERIYSARFDEFGSQPSGSFWLNEQRQTSRFQIILNQIVTLKPRGSVSIADVGCGYGALVNFINKRPEYGRFVYFGFDINKNLVNECKRSISSSRTRFYIGNRPKFNVGFSVMSGTYNLAVTKNIKNWENYIFDCLEACWNKSIYGMVFNLLIAKRAFISDGRIYYTKLEDFKKNCVRQFGPTVAVQESSLPQDVTMVVTRK